MTDKERELLIKLAKICAEGRGQEGSKLIGLCDEITHDVYIKSISDSLVDE